MLNMNLHLNENLFGSEFSVTTYKEDGAIETSKFVDNCYLIGQSDPANYSIAVSDCDGLVSALFRFLH